MRPASRSTSAEKTEFAPVARGGQRIAVGIDHVAPLAHVGHGKVRRGHVNGVVDRPGLLHPQVELARRPPRLRRAEDDLRPLQGQGAGDLRRVDVAAEHHADHAEIGLEHRQFLAAAVLRDAILADHLAGAVPDVGPGGPLCRPCRATSGSFKPPMMM